MNTGATFSKDGKHRHALWRIWNDKKPIFMFIGLNPSTANQTSNDNTISKLMKVTYHNGGGGFYMMNLFTFISTDPKLLDHTYHDAEDMGLLSEYSLAANLIVFCWGNFPQAKERAGKVVEMFENAACLVQNKNGSPKHPLYCADKTILKQFDMSLFTGIKYPFA